MMLKQEDVKELRYRTGIAETSGRTSRDADEAHAFEVFIYNLQKIRYASVKKN